MNVQLAFVGSSTTADKPPTAVCEPLPVVDVRGHSWPRFQEAQRRICTRCTLLFCRHLEEELKKTSEQLKVTTEQSETKEIMIEQLMLKESLAKEQGICGPG